jgi:hypothetical protein
MTKRGRKPALSFLLIPAIVSICHSRYILVEVDSTPQGKCRSNYQFS